MLQIKPLSNTNLDQLFQAFHEAFLDYDFQWSKSQFISMLDTRGYNANLSFGAFEDDQLVAFTFNCIREYDGVKTAYDTGTGTLKGHRGQGLAETIFRHSIPFLRQNQVKCYLLEVLHSNSKAISLYEKLGFEKRREFYYFNQEKVEMAPSNLKQNVDVRRIQRFEDIDFSFCDFNPPWQNTYQSIQQKWNDLISLGAYSNDLLIGYIVFESQSTDISQIAVSRKFRRSGVGTLLWNEAKQLMNREGIKIVNVPTDCNSLLTFLKSKNIHPSGKQYEMIQHL